LDWLLKQASTHVHCALLRQPLDVHFDFARLPQYEDRVQGVLRRAIQKLIHAIAKAKCNKTRCEQTMLAKTIWVDYCFECSIKTATYIHLEDLVNGYLGQVEIKGSL